jgi:phosphoenolpyruvate carboxylase
MSREWYFMRSITADSEAVLAKADMEIARLYSELAGPLHDEFWPIMAEEFELTCDLVLEYSDHEALLETDVTLQRAIMLRNPYVDPMSLLQIDLLERWRSAGCEDADLFEALLASVNGIPQGLQNTG